MKRTERVFKTAWFTKASKQAHISDQELCVAISQVMLGQADDLAGGVYKKRLGKNLYRSIIVAKAGRHWVYEYLFAKKDQSNIESDDLIRFRNLAKDYASVTTKDIDHFITDGYWVEVCHESKVEV